MTTPNNNIRKIKFTNKELIWIERTADIECSFLLNNFFKIMEQQNKGEITETEKELYKKYTSELIETYVFLKLLRTKLEYWDCRYDVDTEIEQLEHNCTKEGCKEYH